MTQISQQEKISGETICWFCEQEIADPQSSVIVLLRKELRREYNKVIYDSKGIRIPRCTQCAKERKRIKSSSTLATIILIGLIGAGFALNLLLPDRFPWFIAPCTGGLLWLGYFWFVVIQKAIRSGKSKKTTVNDYPEIKVMQKDGWEVFDTQNF